MLLWKGVFGNLWGGFVGERPRWSVTKAARRLCWGRTSVWLFSCGFVAYFSGCLFMRAPLEGYFCIRNTHYIYIYVIMKTMCPPSYHHNGFVATHVLGHMMYMYTHNVYVYTYTYIHTTRNIYVYTYIFINI